MVEALVRTFMIVWLYLHYYSGVEGRGRGGAVHRRRQKMDGRAGNARVISLALLWDCPEGHLFRAVTPVSGGDLGGQLMSLS